MIEMTSTVLWMTAVGSLNALLALGVQVALLIVTLSVIQRERPDAVPLLLTSATLDFLTTVAAFLLPVLLGQLVGVAAFAPVNAVAGVVFTIAHTAARTLTIFALIRLVRPVSGARWSPP